MITIEYLYDKNDRQQFIDCLNDIVLKAQTESQYGEMAGRIAQALDYIEDIGIPPSHLRTITGISTKGDTITLTDIVKELKDHPSATIRIQSELETNRRFQSNILLCAGY